MAVKKIYGLRIYKDGDSCAEFTYYSLEQIHRRTMKYENALDLSNEMKSTFKEKYPEFYNKDSFYSAEIVYYPNKKETQNIAKNSEYGEFRSNGIPSEYIPVMYKKDSKLFDLDYLEQRFYSLLSGQNSNFRNRLENFYSGSTMPSIDKNGNKTIKPSINIYRDVLGVIKAYKNGTSNDLDYNISKLYDKVILGGLAERTKIYTIMEKEFPLKAKKQINQEPVQTEMDFREEVSWIDYFTLSDEERKNYKQGPMQEGDSQRLLTLMTNKENTKKR